MASARGDLASALRAFLQCGLILDAWLAGVADESLSFASQALMSRTASALVGEQRRQPRIAEAPGALPSAGSLDWRAAFEVLTCSAAAVAHERAGRVVVDADTAAEAVRRLTAFVGRQGFAPLVRVFRLVTAVQSQGAVVHYGQMLERDFLRGSLHRPWACSPLDDELRRGLAAGHYRVVRRAGRRYVVPTAAGRRSLARARALLAATGYLAARLHLTWVSHFNLPPAGGPEARHRQPPVPAERLAFTRFCGVGPRMAVLEVGCGDGTQMFDGGLWEAAAPGGSLVGLDPAVGQIARARRRAGERGARNVRFVRGRAERLPFSDRQFDAAVAVGLLEFVDAGQAVAEMRRVVRPGGWVTVVGAGQGVFDPGPVRDWFQPLLHLAARYGIDPERRAGAYTRLGAIFHAAGLTHVETAATASQVSLIDPEATLKAAAQGSDFVLEVLERLPWAARADLLAELSARGRALWAAAPGAGRTLALRTHCARGAVP